MTRVSVAERARLSVLVGSRLFRNFTSLIKTNPLQRWRFASGKTDRLMVAPQDLRTADATRASEIYSGQFAFAGKVVICDRRSPFEMTPPSDEWATILLGFGWMRHLRAADTAITRANARALVEDWVNLQGGWHATGWRVDIVARRVLSWLSQSPLVLQDADTRFYRRFIRSLSRQVRYLQNNTMQARDGLPRLQVLIALTYATLCLQQQSRHLRLAARRLGTELDRQILPDGGHISRNPGVLIELLLDLLPLRQLYTHHNLPPPARLNNAIDRIMPMLRFFRHVDGNFAHFNGMGPTPVDLLAAVLAYDDARGTPVAYAPHSGYQRIEAGKSALLMDTGRPPPIAVSQEAHAGCLSFEFSWKRTRLVINCGLPDINRENWRPVARASPAHSTVTFNERSFCRFTESGSVRRLLFGTPLIGGPRSLEVAREETEEGVILRASHDGYAHDLGLVHRRTLTLAAEGTALEGVDEFVPHRGKAIRKHAGDEFAIRFHLHPAVKANRLSDRHGVMLTLPGREVWTFSTAALPVEIEESVYLGGADGPRRTVQIVINGHARENQAVQWSFRYTPRASHAARAAPTDEPELPL